MKVRMWYEMDTARIFVNPYARRLNGERQEEAARPAPPPPQELDML
jgi:hypothetical protein